MTDVTIRVKGMEELAALLAAAPREVRNTANGIVRKAIPNVRRNIVNELHKTHGVSKKYAKIRSIRTKQRVKLGLGRVWIGHNPIQAAYLGRLQDAGAGAFSFGGGGAFAGQFYFENAFIKTFKSGHRTLVRRVGRKLVEETANLSFAEPVIKSEVDRLEGSISATIEGELRRKVGVL